MIKNPERYSAFDPLAQERTYSIDGLGKPTIPDNIDTLSWRSTNHAHAIQGSDGLDVFGPNSPFVYPFTTEHLTGYVPSLDLEGLSVAAICGSGDFAFNALMYGAKEIHAVDVVKRACLYAELKLMGILGLSIDEFQEFFTGGVPANLKRYDPAIYEQILRGGLSESARYYFDQFYSGNINMAKHLLARTLIPKVDDRDDNARMNPYLQSAENYNAAHDAASDSGKSIKFYPFDFLRFTHMKRAIYDLVYLSNMNAYNDDPTQVISGALRILKSGGRIVEFVCNDSDQVRQDLYQTAGSLGLNAEFRQVDCVQDSSVRDLAVIYS